LPAAERLLQEADPARQNDELQKSVDVKHNEQQGHEQIEALDRQADPEPRHRHRRAAQKLLVGGPGNHQAEVQTEACVIEERAPGLG
jgi:hypothetical protein